MTPQISYDIGRRRRRDTSPVYHVSIRVDIDGFSMKFDENDAGKTYRYFQDANITSISRHDAIQR